LEGSDEEVFNSLDDGDLGVVLFGFFFPFSIFGGFGFFDLSEFFDD